MTPEQIERVFGRGRLKMVTGEHVEVFREAVVPGERRRYTKRFLNSTDGDFAHWTEREWRILARLIGHGIGCVPDVVQFDRGSAKGAQLVQTYDAGVTVDQWATLLPLYRDGHVHRHAFEDCAHWWALAHYCLKALKEIHQLQLVHLDIKGDNVCIPFGPASFDPEEDDAPLYPLFGQLALIDFAFSLVSGESLTVALPIGWQREYDYQSPRLLQALIEGHDGDLKKTRELDWRCDIYSLAAMLKRYLPDDVTVRPQDRVTGWTTERYDAAKALIVALRQHHDSEAPLKLPHQAMIEATGAMLTAGDLAQSLAAGWTLARDITLTSGIASPLTPMTRIAPPVRVFRNPRERVKEAPHEQVKEAPQERVKEAPQERRVAEPPRGEAASGAPRGRAAVDLVTAPPLVFAAPTDLRMARAARRDTGVPLLITRRKDATPPPSERRARAAVPAVAIVLALALGAAIAHQIFPDATKGALAGARNWFAKGGRGNDSAPSAAREPATNVAAAEAPPAASSPNAASAVEPPPAAPTESTEDPADAGDADSGDAGAPAPKSKADSALAPPASRPSPRAAPQASESPRTAAKRPATKSAPPPLARSSTPSAPAATARTPSGRYATSAPRGPAVALSPYSPSGGSVPTSPETARVDTAQAPAQIVELVPPSSHPAHTEATSTPTAPPTARTGASNPPATQPQGSVSVPESIAATPNPSSPRRSRPLAADEEWRAGLNAVARFFGLTQRKTAPIEERGFQEVTPPAKPARAPQSALPPQDRPMTATPKMDPQPLASAPPVLPVAPRIDTPPPIALTPPLSRVTTPPPSFADSRADFRGSDRMRESDYAREARRALVQSVPRIATQTQSEVAPVLWAASKAQDPRGEREVVDSAQAIWGGDGTTTIAQPVEPTAARRLNEEAMRAYWVRRNIPEAFDLSLKAFGANPNDPEVAGNLAFLHLRMSPSQPETARQLALHAIAVRGTRFRTGRLEDWNTYALASALTGRDTDARNAMYVTVALAGSVERNCKAGLSAIANYGERVREPVEAMMYRIHTQGRAYESPYCAWPPNWAIGMRRQ